MNFMCNNNFIFSLIVFLSLNSCSSSEVKVVKLGPIDTTNNLHKPQPYMQSSQKLEIQELDSFNQIAIYNISEEQLHDRLEASKALLKRVVFYKSHCNGVNYVMNDTKKYDSLYGDKMDNILILMNNNSDEKAFQYQRNLLYENGIHYPTYIIDTSIPDYSDDRKRGKEFLESICEECKNLPLSGVYWILYNDKNEMLTFDYSANLLDSIPASYLGE